MAIRSMEYLKSLVRELVKLPSETEWVEFNSKNVIKKMKNIIFLILKNNGILNFRKTKRILC